MSAGRIHVGTSGYSYPGWKGGFYPEKLAAKDFLRFYAGKLDTVEINNTFYRFPGEKVLLEWAAQTPDGFTFAVKATRRITHFGMLRNVEELTRDFVERCAALGGKLGPILFQLPPTLKRDDERLAAFLACLPRTGRYAVEFRHKSWFDDAVFDALAGRGAALCVSHGEKLDTPRRTTAAYVYVRLRQEDYSADELREWRGWIEEQSQAGREMFVYFKHDETGGSPEQALALLRGL